MSLKKRVILFSKQFTVTLYAKALDLLELSNDNTFVEFGDDDVNAVLLSFPKALSSAGIDAHDADVLQDWHIMKQLLYKRSVLRQ